MNVFLILIVLLSTEVEQFSFRQLNSHRVIEDHLARYTPGEHFNASLSAVKSVTSIVGSVIGQLQVPFDNSSAMSEDVDLSIDRLIRKYGFPVEDHTVETEDGYILKMFRIPSNGSAVFVMHGLLTSSDDFVISGPESGLAYLLAKEGYDVWLGNSRGNKHSRAHRTLSPMENKFWEFSWHEIGVLDLPAMIDYVLDLTGEKRLKFVGHSQGSTSYFAMAADRPEYNDKISVMVALSPIAIMAHMTSPMFKFLATNPVLTKLQETLGAIEIFPDSLFTRNVMKLLCPGRMEQIQCFNIVFLIVGFDFPQLNPDVIPAFIGHLPAGSSSKQLAHYAQIIRSGQFEKFDHGSSVNMQKYGSARPPRYNLSRATAPVALFYSEDDQLASAKDVITLSKVLPNVVDMYKVPHENFNHLDFILAKDFKTLIFDRLLHSLRGY